MTTFSTKSSFNDTNFMKCIELIQYTHNLYEKSIKQPIIMNTFKTEMNTKFHLEDAILFEGQATPDIIPSSNMTSLLFYQDILTGLLPLPSLLQSSSNSSATSISISSVPAVQSIIGVGGIIKGTRIAVISLRGTGNDAEWILDIQSLQQIPISISKKDQDNEQLEPLINVSMSFPNVNVGKGFLKLYCSTTNTRNDSNGCICKTPCDKGSCLYYQNGYYSQIQYECEKNFGKCLDSPSPSLQHQIYNFLLKNKCTQVILTGHSLGAALANLCAFHLQYAFSREFIHSVYSFAPPKTGNPSFAKSLEPLQDKFYTIINSNDLIPASILPILPSLGYFSHVGQIKTFNALLTNDPNSLNYIWIMHSLDTYKLYYNDLKTSK